MKHWTDYFDAKTMSKGLAQARNRQVSEIYGRDHGLEGVVEGDTGVYGQTLSWSKRVGLSFEGLVASCTCPVGEFCKHTVAVISTLFERERQKKSLLPVPEGWSFAEDSDDLDDDEDDFNSDERSDVSEKDFLEAIANLKKKVLPHETNQRTTANPPHLLIKPVPPPVEVATHVDASEPEPTVTLFNSKRQDPERELWLRKVGEHTTHSEPSEQLRAVLSYTDDDGWQILPVSLRRLKRDAGWGIGKRFRSWRDLDYLWDDSGPGRFPRELRSFTEQLLNWSEDYGSDGFLRNGLGSTLTALIATGLLTMEPIAGGPVTMGPTGTGSLSWIESDDGWRLTLLVAGVPAKSDLIEMDSLWWISPSTRQVGQVTLPFDMDFLDHIEEMPYLPLEVLSAVTVQLRQLYVDVPEPPAAPALPIPVPVLRAWRGTLTANEWSNRKVEHDLALISFRYGAIELPANGQVIEDNGKQRIVRNVAVESARLEELVRAGLTCLDGLKQWKPTSTRYPASSVFLVVEQGAISPPALAMLRATGWDISGRSATDVEVVDLGPLAAEVKEDGGWFDLALGTDIGGVRVDLVPLLTPLLRGGPVAWKSLPTVNDAILVPHGDKRLLRVPLTLLQSLHDHLLALFTRERGATWRLNAWDAGVLAALDGFGITILGAERLRAIAAAVSNPLQAAPTPPGMQAELRPYQSEGLAWLQRLRSVDLGGILADDMGLGKTVQVIAHFAAEHAAERLDRPCLVVCPASMVGTWQRELARFTPDLKTIVLHGNKRDTAGLGAGMIGITTYGVLHRDIAQLEKIPLHIAVCDEAQVVKNAGTKAAQALRKLDARQRLCLTGTPLENHLGELHAQVTWAAPGLFGSRAAFDETFVKPIEAGEPGRADALRRRMKLVLLRRTKNQVATDLPPRSESVVMVEMSARQRAFYEAIRLSMDKRIRDVIKEKGINRSGIEVIEALLRLRQVACDPALLKTPEAIACGESAKLDALAEMLPTMIEDGRRILIFSQFTSFLDRIEEVVLKPAQMTWLRLDGQTSNRQDLVDRFQAHEAPLFLLSLKAGGTGLTLTAADTVILADPWWNPAVEAQAADRAHRIGQTQPVLIYRLVCAGTIEEKVLALQARKRALADALYDETGQSLGSLTAEDLAALLAPMTS